jgi:hypothetical protein
MEVTMKPFANARVLLIGVLLASSQACSLAFVRGPPTGQEELTDFACTDNHLWPALDAIGVVGGLIGAATATDDDPANQPYFSWTFSKEENVAASLGIAVLLGASAGVGLRRVSACQDALSDLRARLGVPIAPVSMAEAATFPDDPHPIWSWVRKE